jgi:N utilization substance protein B
MQSELDSQSIQKYKKRHNARLLAAQCLYSWQVTQTPIAEAKSAVLMLSEMANIDYDDDFFEYLSKTIIMKHLILDESLAPFIKLGVNSLHPIERAIAWIATLELTTMPQLVPSSIIINEAVQLTKELSDLNAYRFMNAVLDSVAKNIPSN